MKVVSALLISAVFTLGLSSRARWPRFTIEAFPSRARRYAALLLLAATLAFTVFLPLLTFERPSADTDLGDLAFPALFLGHAVIAAFLIGWWLLGGRRPLGAFLHLRPTNLGRNLRLGLGAGIGAWAVTMVAMIVVGSLASQAVGMGAPDPDLPGVVRSIVDLSLGKRLMLIASAMIVEEAFFRSFLQSRCGLVVSSLMFTFGHSGYGLPLMLVGVFVVSIVLGWMFQTTDNVLPCMIAHGVFDGVQLLIVLPILVGAS
jgi:membrane protease YdiL (CAAX protease family)